MSNAIVKQISECFIKPKHEVEEGNKPYYLAPMDLAMLSLHYSQKGLLFTKPSHFDDGQQFSINKFLDRLKDSLSLTLVHFYPLAGQLVTQVDEARHESLIFVDCNKDPGSRFIYATLDMTISDILSPIDVLIVVQSFFDHHKAVNYDGHFTSLLSVKITELVDGIFIGCSMNHPLADGTSYWHFWNMWSEIHRFNNNTLSIVPPIHRRWFPDGYAMPVSLPFTHPDEFIVRYEPPQLRERVFNFPVESMARLKAKANKENKNDDNSKIIISSFQALSALCWRGIVRANRLPNNQVTNCRLSANNRQRLSPPLPQEYFGNYLTAVKATTTAGELLEHNFGWAASMVHESVVTHNDKIVSNFINEWMESPLIYQHHKMFDPYSVMMGSSPRFDMYGNEFGIGKAVAVRSGYANKYVGKVNSHQGYQGIGSVELEICLSPDSMRALETDTEFMEFVHL